MTMFVDKISYQISKLLRRVKVTISRIDRTQVLRTMGILIITFAVLGSAPPNDRKPQIVNSKSEEGVVAGEKSPTDEGKSLALETPAERGSELPLRLPDSPPVATVSAQAVYIIDNETEAVLFEKNPDQRLPMASLTKIMTALVVLKNYQLDEMVTVPKECTGLPPFKVGYAVGQKLNVEELLYGMLVTSASDASCALSHHFEENFLELMNQKALELNLSQTHFENEIGLDGENGNHLSTAKDLVKLSKGALKNGVFRKIVGTAQWQGLTSTNELLFTLPGTTGIKTGFTEQAGGCLAVSYERSGREILGVILGSEDRFLDARQILNWIFEAYQWP